MRKAASNPKIAALTTAGSEIGAIKLNTLWKR
jgi:hypothetical protein